MITAGQASATSHIHLRGRVTDTAGLPLRGVAISSGRHAVRTGNDGQYELTVEPGMVTLNVLLAGGEAAIGFTLQAAEDRSFDMVLRPEQAVSVNGVYDILDPDPSAKGYSRHELLDANPVRPGVPFSIPGFPAETASGGIKAPQYFAPGVAGDHGEPIAQYIDVGGFLLPNNLTANAHGNGYADPNFLIGGALGGVVVDAGGFNVRYGDHAINLAATLYLRGDAENFISTATDGRDVAVSGLLRTGNSSWLAGEFLGGDGWQTSPEGREQGKINARQTRTLGKHELNFFEAAYYGYSHIPGLIPLDFVVPSGTIDVRQSDRTHTAIAAGADRWRITPRQTLSSGAFVRTYSLDLRSNFGDGLIRQSEFRTVLGGSSVYTALLPRHWTLLAGLDLWREAPRGLDLQHFDEGTQRFRFATSNDLTLVTTSPFAAVAGPIFPWAHVYAGLRHDQVCFNNQDLLTPANSFASCPGITDPKINLVFGQLDAGVVPQLSLSFAKAFHANDPRIGLGGGQGQLLIRAREYQAVVDKRLRGTEMRLTLAQVASSAELAKIDADTGLQQDVGPSLNRYLTLLVSHRTSNALLQASWSEADARDRNDGTPVPEAPRMIVDSLAQSDRLPRQLSGKVEFEYVKAKPLGDAFTGRPLLELRTHLSRQLGHGAWSAAVDGLLTTGFTGQTLETLNSSAVSAGQEQIVGVPATSYGSVSLTYTFHH